MLDGFVIWGDVAYRENMFFAPDYWRTYYKPTVAKIVDMFLFANGLSTSLNVLPGSSARGITP